MDLPTILCTQPYPESCVHVQEQCEIESCIENVDVSDFLDTVWQNRLVTVYHLEGTETLNA